MKKETRQKYKMAALTGMLSNPAEIDKIVARMSQSSEKDFPPFYKQLAEHCGAIANAMLEEDDNPVEKPPFKGVFSSQGK